MGMSLLKDIDSTADDSKFVQDQSRLSDEAHVWKCKFEKLQADSDERIKRLIEENTELQGQLHL